MVLWHTLSRRYCLMLDLEDGGSPRKVGVVEREIKLNDKNWQKNKYELYVK